MSVDSITPVNDPMLKNDLQLTAIAIATEEFLEEVRKPSDKSEEEIIQEYADRYPDIKVHIEDLFPALIGVEKIARDDVQPSVSRDPGHYPEFQDYEIKREIGRGGMGVVYEAWQKSLNRRVALKTLSLDADFNPEYLQRFRREAQVAASLHHSNIVPVFDVGFESGVHFFTMQFIDGANLADLCSHFRATRAKLVESKSERKLKRFGGDTTREVKAGLTSKVPDFANEDNADFLRTLRLSKFTKPTDRIDLGEIARIGAQIADALHYIHLQGVVHRDIKPSNILLDFNGTAWLADWGLVKSELSDLTQTGDLFGSLAYMAPERFKGRADGISDIYSLGVTLYELLTLTRIFEVENQAELVALIVNQEPRRPREIDSDISLDFENVILKAIDKQPEARYRSSAEFADDLRNLIAGRPVSARSLTTREKLVRWCQNRPMVAALTGIVALLLVVGITVSSMFAVRANSATNLAKLGEKQSDESLEMFFGTFFPRAHPDKGASMTPELREAMDNAVDSIMSAEKYDSVVVGKLFSKLGWIYFNQQDYDRALDVFQHAVDRVSREHGESHEVAMKALDHVGMTLMRQNRFLDSEKALIKAWTLQAENLGVDHENTIHSYAKLGDLYQDMGRFDDSIEITKEVLKVRQRPGRPDSQFALVSMNGLACAYIQKEQPAAAIEWLETVVKAKEDNDEIDIGLSYTLHNLARAFRMSGNLEKAMELNDRCLQIRRKELSETSDAVLAARAFGAGVLAESGNAAEALPLLQEIWKDASDSPLPVRRGKVLLELGLCLKRLNRDEEALMELTAASKILDSYVSPRNLYSRMAKSAIEEMMR